jgi:SagB-type dehydrogenase family enzyme
MKRSSRPVIITPLGRDGKGLCFSNQNGRIGIPEERLTTILKMLNEAKGQSTIEELALSSGLSIGSLLVFFDELEGFGMCRDAHYHALYGHYAGDYPDQLRRVPDDATIEELMKLPPDPDGALFGAAGLDNPADPILRRRTTRRFSKYRPLTFDGVSRIAFAAYGITGSAAGWSPRTVPSGGAMYPLELDYIVLNAGGLAPGLYRWAKHRNGFIFRRPVEHSELEQAFGTLQPQWQEAALVQVIWFDIERSGEKYASRALRFAMLEAGHAAQNAMLAATRLHIGSWEYGGYDDSALQELVGATSPTSGIATVVFYGNPE